LVVSFSRIYQNNPANRNIQTIPVNSTSQLLKPKQPQPQHDTFKTGRHWERLVKNEERGGSKISTPREATPDVELLQALTHEIRTPSDDNSHPD
jgi:hypothetical protein